MVDPVVWLTRFNDDVELLNVGRGTVAGTRVADKLRQYGFPTLWHVPP